MNRNQNKFYHRVQSANSQTHRKQRILSGRNFKDISNGQITQSFQDKWQNNNFMINKNIITPGLTNEQIGRKKRVSSKLTNKSIEELFQNNLQLKKQNNKLIQQLTQLKGRFEAKSRKGSQKAKQLDLQFQKQLYWGGSKTYLISGIKYQYQKLKQKYNEQKNQYQRIKKAFLQAKIPQYQIYIQNLEVQNKKLNQKLNKMIQIANRIPQTSRKVSQALISQHQQNNKKLESKITDLKNELTYAQQSLEQREKKIIFLQKILIEKENKDYNQGKKFRKLQKTVKQLSGNNTALLNEIQKNRISEQEREKQLKDRHKRRQQEIKQQMAKQIAQLKNKIHYLIQDKRQLQNNLNKLKMSMSAHSQRPQRRNSISINPGSFLIMQSNSPSLLNNNSLTPTNIQIPQASSFHGYQSDQSSNEAQRKRKLKPRVMQTADKRHSSLAIKQRKVDYSQITQIGQLVKLRLISAGINKEGMKKLFDHKKPQSYQLRNQSGELAQVWQDVHISMKETKNILKSKPFNLNEQAAHLLARYLIEDCNEQYVYCDQNNQNKREIVKSILKSLLGDFSLPTQIQEAQLADFKNKYLNNFYSALKTYYPNGKVNKKKFMQVLTSMGTDLSQKAIQALVAKIVAKSSNLSELQYFELENI